jgi:GNAT superfamily N-acetyltransferase
VKSLAVLFDKYRVFYKMKTDIRGAEMFLSDRISNNESVIFCCFESTDSIAGFVQLYPLFSSTRMQRIWLLNDLFVDEIYRGKGYSVTLIDAAKDHCLATKSAGLMLETGKENLIGNKLYHKTGFRLNDACNFYSWNVSDIKAE